MNIQKLIKNQHAPFAIGLFLLIVVQGLVLKNWATRDTQPLAWDQAIHTRVAMDYQEQFPEHGLGSFLRPAYFGYPPFYHANLIPFLDVVDDVSDVGALVNFFYLIILIVAVYLLGVRFLGPSGGFLSAVLVSCYPIIVKLSHYTMIDLPLTALVTLSMYFLIRSEDFKYSKWSALFGATIGLAMLTKWTALAYVIGPVAVSKFRMFRRREFKHFFWAVLAFSLMVGPWYLLNFFPMMANILRVTNLPPASGIQYEKILNSFWYVFAFFEQINVFYVILFVPGLILAFRKPQLRPLLIWIGVSILLFSLIRNRNVRYTMPILPAVAILSIAWLPIKRKAIAIGTLVGILLVYVGMLNSSRSRGYVSLGPVQMVMFPAFPAAQKDWKHKEIIKRVHELRNPEAAFTRIVTLSNAAFFHSTTIEITRRKMGLDGFSFRGPSKRRWLEFSEFALYKTGKLGPEGFIGRVQKCADFIKNPLDWFGNVYKEVGRWPLPDQTEAVLFQAKPDPEKVFDIGILNVSLDEMKFARVEAKGVQMKAVPISPEQTSVGRLKELSFQCKEVNYKRLTFKDVEITLIKPQVNLPMLLETQEIQFLSLERLVPNVSLHSDTLLSYASKKLKWLKNPKIVFEGPRIKVEGKASTIPISLEADLTVRDQWLHPKLVKLRIAHIPFPLFLIKSLTNRSVNLRPNRETPFYFDIKNVQGQQDLLKLGA